MRSTPVFLLALLPLCALLLLAGCPPADDDDSAAADDDDVTADDDDTAVDDDDTAVDDDDTTDPGEPPTATVDLLPDAPSSDDLLVAAITTSDPEGAPVTVKIRWTVDGAPVPAYEGLTFVPGSATSAGQEWTVTVTPNDGGQDGTAVSDSVTVGNQPPVLYAVSIAPAAPAEGDDVVATPGGTSDPEGDAVTVSYVWMVNGVDAGVSGDTLSSDHFGKGDTIKAVATPNDGSSDGGAVVSNTVVAVNTAPTATGATVDPTSGFEDTTFTCSGQGFDDADGDAEAWLYTWVVNGIFNIDGATLDGTFFNRGDYLVCHAWPTDGDTAGAVVAATPILVSNTPPALADAAITPDPATSSATLTAVPGAASDIDGDSVVFHFAWTVEGSPAGADLPILPPSEFVRGDEVVVVVTPTDGANAGAAVTAPAVTIGNSPPAFTGVELTYDAGADAWVATGLGWSDADGDAAGYVYAWASSAGPLTESTGILDAAALTAPDTVTVTLTAHDGIEAGNTIASATVDHGPILAAVLPRADFGRVDLGCAPRATVPLTNLGTSNLTVSALNLTETLGSGYFNLPELGAVPIVLDPGATVNLHIDYDAFDESEAAADLEIVSDDPSQPSVTIPITASATPGAIYEEQFVGSWDNNPYELAYVPAGPIEEIEQDYDIIDYFIYDPIGNTIDPNESISTGELTIVRYVPMGFNCHDNLAPIAVATLVTASPSACVATEIDLSESYDPDGDEFSFRFDFLSVAPSSALTGDAVTQTATSASVLTDADGDYELAVSGVDTYGAEGAPASVLFAGLAQAGGGTNSPVADAGSDVEGGGTARCFEAPYGDVDCTPCTAAPVRLDGTGSYDPDGTGLIYAWSVQSGDLEILEGGDSATPLVGLPADPDDVGGTVTVYPSTLELTVTDCDGLQETSTVQATITCVAPTPENVGVLIRD